MERAGSDRGDLNTKPSDSTVQVEAQHGTQHPQAAEAGQRSRCFCICSVARKPTVQRQPGRRPRGGQPGISRARAQTPAQRRPGPPFWGAAEQPTPSGVPSDPPPSQRTQGSHCYSLLPTVSPAEQRRQSLRAVCPLISAGALRGEFTRRHTRFLVLRHA